ncbi:MAG: glycosyltransferase [Anaerolineales bacterium]|jgi:glycosyltransferase involved in cell wall biosynthesis|nr:glycosyltransferase [Anaerolineales bacterium]
MPAVSVLLPCYDAAATLDKALASLAAQTFTDFEIVAVDDGSLDETQQVLHAWQAKEFRLRLVAQAHGGIVAALNHGLSACTAPLVARMDADDWCHPQRLERQVEYLHQHPEVDVLGCQVEAFSATAVGEGLRLYLAWQNALFSDADIRRELFVESPLVHPSVMLRRRVLEAVGGYAEHGWAEDYDLWMRLAQAGSGFARLPEVLFYWRDTPQRLTRADPRYAVQNFLRLKAHYLLAGPLRQRQAIFLWGAGMIGRRLGRLLLRQGAPILAYLDIDPAKIGSTRHHLPILDAARLPALWQQHSQPMVLAAVGTRGARQIIRQRLGGWGLVEGQDWLAVA